MAKIAAACWMKGLRFTAILFLLSCTYATAQEYDIVFHHAAKTGEKRLRKFKLAESNSEETQRNDGIPPASRKKEVTAELTAWVEVLSVDSKGNPTESKVSVESWHSERNGAEVAWFKPHDEVLVKAGTPTQFTVNGSPPGAVQRSFLDEFLGSTRPDIWDDEGCFTPDHKVKVGDSWPINAERAAQRMPFPVPVTKDNLKGSARLEGVTSCNGVQCLQVSTETQIHLAGLSFPNYPPEAKAKSFDFVIKLKGELPVDPGMRDLATWTEYQINAEGGGTYERGGQPREMTFKVGKSQKMEVITLPAPAK